MFVGREADLGELSRLWRKRASARSRTGPRRLPRWTPNWAPARRSSCWTRYPGWANTTLAFRGNSRLRGTISSRSTTERSYFLCGSVSTWIAKNILNNTGFVGRASCNLVVRELPLDADEVESKVRALSLPANVSV